MPGMQSDIVTHVQDSVRPGVCVDMYYANAENSMKQCHPTTVENRYYQDLNSKTFGSASTLLFNPDEGVDHIILTLQLPAPVTGADYRGLALNSGWGYNMIRRVGIRYGGSTLYYFQSDQELIDVLSDAEDSTKKQQLLTLGGQAMLSAPSATPGPGDFSDVGKRTAYVYIKLPHNTPSAQELGLPLPSDLLTSPIQVNIEFKQASEVFLQSANIGGATPVLPQAFALAQAQFRQIHFDDRGEQLARKVNMSEMAYSYPLKYFSQEVFRQTNVQGGTDVPITLTGIRSGNCKGIRVWVKPSADANVLNFVNPNSIQLSVNGLVYFDSRVGQQQLWSLIDRKCSASFGTEIITENNLGGGSYAWQTTPSTGYWVWIPFGQHSEVLANEAELSHGLSLMNSILNLTLNLPALGGGATYTVTAEYLFNSTLLFSRGSCEYVF